MGKDKKDKHGNSGNADMLSTTNPEIFETSPRPGGFVKVLSPDRSQSFMPRGGPAFPGVRCGCPSKKGLVGPGDRSKLSNTTLDSSASRRVMSPSGASFFVPSREFRLNSSLREGQDEQEFSMAFSHDQDHDPFADVHPLYKSMDMMAVCISCVMVMAAGIANIPNEYFIFTTKYLECMKDEDDRHPYNINGILNHIQFIKHGYAQEKKRCGGSSCTGGGGSKKPKTPPEGARAAPEVPKAGSPSSHRTQSSSAPYATPSQSQRPVYGSQSAYSPQASPNSSPNQSYDNVRVLTTSKASKKDKKNY